MAALLKNQILKHLSKFTKNLSSDKINLSTLKGEGELSNLELNEDILTQLLELPTWLKITKAVCNRVAVKIQWTKLKSQPICLYLDEVIVETETCEQPRAPNSQNQQLAGGKYGFVDRVMDGIYVHVNSVVVKLLSHKFHASLQLSRVKVQSMSPTWQIPTDLRQTRIRDPGRGEVLLFKEIEWQTTRIEANAIGLGDDFLTPLRLIANQAKIRIVVKKRLSDCAIISSRLTLLLDDLLWVLTITQLKAAILYANSLKEVIERSAQQSKRLAAEKLKKQGYMPDNIQHQQQQQQQRGGPEKQESTTAKHFNRFDVLSTSYHLITSRFDLHLCDDSSPAQEEKRHWKINGGSMQITFYKLSLDFYPFHPAGGERKSWYRYTDNIGSRNPWVNKLFAEFREEAIKLRKVCDSSSMHSSSSAPSLLAARSSPSPPGTKKTLTPSVSHSVNTSPVHGMAAPSKNVSGSRSAQGSPLHQTQTPRSTRLLETCFVVKIEDMTVYMVSMPGKKRSGPNKLLCSDKRQLHLPPEMSVIHVEFTDYFFPEGLEYPVPHPNLYVLVNPVRVTLDFLTLLWSNVFLLTLSNSVDMDFGEQGPPEHVDIKVELLMPRVILPAEEKVEGQPDRPDAVQLQISKLVVSNCRMEERMSRKDLQALLDQHKKAKIFSSTEFPNNEEPEKEELIPALLYEHAENRDDPYIDKAVKTLLSQNTDSMKLSPSDANLKDITHPAHHFHLPTHSLNCNSLKRLATQDIWSASADQVWLEFLGVQNYKNRPVPFVEAVPVTVWLSLTPNPAQCHKNSSQTTLVVNGNTNKKAQNCSSLSQGEDASVYDRQRHHESSSSTPMPVLGSSPPICDRVDNRFEDDVDTSYNAQSSDRSAAYHSSRVRDHHHRSDSADRWHREHDYNDDGNNHASSYHQYRSHNEDHRPSKLSLAGGGHLHEYSRSNKTHGRTDPETQGTEWSNTYHTSSVKTSHHARDGEFSQYEETYSEGDASRGRRNSSEYGSRQFVEPYPNKSGYDSSHHQARQRREKQFHREDSRSSSSPPLVQSEMGNHRREESRERRSKERRLRHSSSSSSEKREIETGGGRRRGDIDGRSSAEGQVSSDSFQSGDGLVDMKRGDNGYNIESMKSRVGDRSGGRESDVSHGQAYRRSRQSSSSSSDVAPGSSRDRRLHRSGSRDSRGNLFDKCMGEIDNYLPRESHKEEEADRSQRNDRGQWGSPRDGCGRRSARDGSRDRENLDGRQERSESQGYERSARSKKRDQLDGIPSGRHGHSHDHSGDRRGNMSDDARESRHGGRRHRSHSRGGDSDSVSRRHEEMDNYRSRRNQEEVEQRSRSEHSRPRHSDADCDNDRYSHTSQSSLDTIGRDSAQGMASNGQRPNEGDLHRKSAADPRQWSEGGPDRSWTPNNKRPPPEGCKSQENFCPRQEHHKSSTDPEKKICVLTKVCGKLRAQLNHYQYLFLLRLSESFSAFQTDLSADLLSVASINSTSKRSTSNMKGPPKLEPSPIIIIPLVLKELEFAVVCPYQMHQRTFSDDFSVISPFLQGVTTGQDAVFGDEGDGTCFPQLVDVKGSRSKDDSSLKPIQQTITFKSSSSSQLENLPQQVQIPELGGQRGRGHTVANSSFAYNSQTVPIITGPTPFTSDSSRKDPPDIMSQSINSSGKDSGIGIDRKPAPQRQHHSRGGGGGGSRGSANKGPADVKKAFASAFSSFTDKIKNKMENLDDNYGDDLETMSIRTDTSDDDFEHLSLDETEEVPAFFREAPPPDTGSIGDIYSEVGDPGDSISMYAESSTTKGKEMVYVVLFKLDQTEILLTNENEETSAKVQLAKLNSIQLGNISYDDFQTRFSTAKGYLQEEVSDSPPHRYPIRLKFEIPAPDPSLDLPPDPGHLVIRADDFSLQFKMSGLTCLSDFSEDEKLPECLPLSLEITNLLLVLEEDRPPANLTSPGAIPMNLHIQQLSIERGKDGIFYITGNPDSTPFTYSTSVTPVPPKPQQINAVTSPIMSPDGTMALLMASQNEAVLLRRQLEEVRRANRLYEHQILQWREMQDNTNGQRPGMGGAGRGSVGVGLRKRQSFTADSLSSSPSSTTQPDQLAGPARLPRDDVDPARDELERENIQLQQKVLQLEDDLLTVSKEKESLLQTLQLLQDELLASERKQRSKPKS